MSDNIGLWAMLGTVPLTVFGATSGVWVRRHGYKLSAAVLAVLAAYVVWMVAGVLVLWGFGA